MHSTVFSETLATRRCKTFDDTFNFTDAMRECNIQRRTESPWHIRPHFATASGGKKRVTSFYDGHCNQFLI